MEIYRLRVNVFIIEQTCFYEDIDGYDPQCDHLLMLNSNGKNLIGYARIVPPSVKFDEASIGRIVIAPAVRNLGLGGELVKEAMRQCAVKYPNKDIRIEAQAHLEKFYTDLEFEKVSGEYDLDGIPHIEMVAGTNRKTDNG